jgi:UDP-N-acetylmuramate--alanine ligase
VGYRGLNTHFNAYRRGQSLGGFQLGMPGAHNVLNCLATIAVADELEVPLDVTKEALATFSGVGRRFSVVGEQDGVVLIDDYAHHPAEITATLASARDIHTGRIVAVFQPHRFTRTRDVWDEFIPAFNDSDVLFLSEIYSAGEEKILGVEAAPLVAAIRSHGHGDARFVANLDDLLDDLLREIRDGDLVLILGAGSISTLGARLIAKLSGERG